MVRSRFVINGIPLSYYKILSITLSHASIRLPINNLFPTFAAHL